jgi:RNA polymerase sigma factor (sigma-70 family)
MSESPSPHPPPSDRQLLERFVAGGDPAAFEALVARHAPRVRGVCRRLADPHVAEDAVQDTFLVLMRRAHSIDRPELLGNWLYGVAARIARKAKARGLERRSREKRGAPPSPVPDPLTEAAWRDLCALLTAEMDRLPEKFRAPLFLCYWEGKTNLEAARQLGCPAGSMSWRLARGRDMLRARLGTRCLP